VVLACLSLGCGPAVLRGTGASDGGAPPRGQDAGDALVLAGLGGVDAPAADRPTADWKCAPGLRSRLGLPCGCGEECESGICADGVCCNLPCRGACHSCKLDGRMGSCEPVAIGAPDPHGICTKEAPETCGRTGLCAFASCARYPPGTRCRAPSCSGGSVLYPHCDTDGTCAPGTPINCSPSICADGACRLECASGADCASPHACMKGSCGVRGPGQPCSTADQCQSGFCADGVCCDTACTGSCVSCALPGTPGQCAPVPAGAADPRGGCADQGPSACGTNGHCDGAGACQKYPAGTVCKPGGCDAAANRWTPDAVCGASGCETPPARGCAPFRCDAEGRRCADTCAGNDGCEAPAVCRSGSCGKKILGSLCARGDECASGFCAQGVCCNSACTAGCFACNLPASLGACTALPDGAADPSGQCKDQGAASCGTDGTCDGNGGCSKYGPGTVCAAQSCGKGMKTAPSRCDGLGACVAGSKVTCAPYVCDQAGTDCFSSCHGTGAAPECAAPSLCNDQRCGRANKGQSCGATADCAAGLTCVEGLCCDSPCQGPCNTCKKTPGTCTPVAAGTISRACKVDPAKPCGQNGKCDGAGRCALAAATTTCAAARCTGDRAGSKAALCDGNGTCAPAAPLACGANRCVAGVCAACARDADCLDSKACDTASGLCGAGNASGVACTAATQCAAAACVDGRCCEKSACGTCQRCGPDGKCAPVTSAPDPDSCPDESASNPCGRRGCDATGACPRPPATTVISGPACKDDATTTVTTCDGNGGTTVTDTPCLAPDACIAGACSPKLDAGPPDAAPPDADTPDEGTDPSD
jgi:hypothetical protein